MATKQPPLEPEHFYHLYNHANGDENIFVADENYRFFLKHYSFYISEIVDTLAYCLMPNHFHFLVKIKPKDELQQFYTKQGKTLEAFETLQGVFRLNSFQFSHLFNSYAQAFNKQNNRKGGLFISNFKRNKVTSDTYLLNLIHYIHNNPVHHGFVKKMDEWNYSSYHALFSDKKTVLSRKETIGLFSGVKEYKEFHQRNVDKDFLRTIDFE